MIKTILLVEVLNILIFSGHNLNQTSNSIMKLLRIERTGTKGTVAISLLITKKIIKQF